MATEETSSDMMSNDALPTEVYNADMTIQDKWMKGIYIVIGVLGILGNVMVIAVIGLRKTMRRSNTNYLILNQSTIDLTAAVLLVFIALLEKDDRYFDSLADRLYCMLWLSRWPLWSILVSSTCSLVFLSIERYLAVVHPIWHRNHYGRRQLVGSAVLSWVIGPVNGIYDFATSGISADGQCFTYHFWPSATFRTAYGLFVAVIQFFIPIAIHIFCYGRMAWVLSRKNQVSPAPATATEATSTEVIASANSTMTTKGTMNARATRNIFKTLISVVICFFLCWVSNQVLWFVFNLGVEVDLTSAFFHFTVVAVFANCCVNPFVYLAKYELFQKALKSIILRKSEGTTHSSTSNKPATAVTTQG